MTQVNPSYRPKWDELQEHKNLWSSDLEKFDIENEIKNEFDFKSKNGEKVFIYSILVFDLMKISEKKLRYSGRNVKNSESMKQSETLIIRFMQEYSHNSKIVEKYLHHLFRYKLDYAEPRDREINLIIYLMGVYSEKISIQRAGLQCLNNITRNESAINLDQKILENVIDVTLKKMKDFPNHQYLHETALLILCNDCILNFYNRNEIIRIFSDTFNTFNDIDFFIRICSKISNKISLPEYLPSLHLYFEKLLEVVRTRLNCCQNSDSDKRFDKTLDSIWSLTDSSLKYCEIFIDKGGLNLYQRALSASLKMCLKFPKIKISFS
jgi:hypothetical protein